jgi:hypothetical protein
LNITYIYTTHEKRSILWRKYGIGCSFKAFSTTLWRIGDIENDQPSLHIMYYSWDHYSSARNTDGPHSRLPNIHVQWEVAEQECHVPESGTKKEQIELTDFEKIVMFGHFFNL